MDKDECYDVIVIGSGAGGMAAAVRAHDLGLKTLLIEKAARYGGTTALSGGGIWVPNNEDILSLPMGDSPEEALTYVRAAVQGEAPEQRLLSYLENAPRVVRWLHDHTRVRYKAVECYPDYYPHLPGWKPGARTMEPCPFNLDLLGDEAKLLYNIENSGMVMGRAMILQAELMPILARKRGWLFRAARTILRYWLDIPARLKGRVDRRLTCGTALVAALRQSMRDRGIPLWLETAFRSFVVENGRVTGIVAERNGNRIEIRARYGVIVAAGGFERNQAMREEYLPSPTNADWSATPPTNTGDGIRAGMAIGAATGFMNLAWWVPSVAIPGADRQVGLFADRTTPGLVCVNKQGRRFVNEGVEYQGFGNAMYKEHARMQGCVPAWMVFDATHRKRYLSGPLTPGWLTPDSKLPANWLDTVYYKADTIEELAAKIGVDASGLKQTIERMNEFARTGVDADFHKGNRYDRFMGDPSVKPNPCLAPIDRPPFYALRLDAGDIGTKGGLLIDEQGRVMSTDGSAIEGLYACGNSSASVMGPSYPGPGSTIGPAIVIGCMAAEDIARKAADNNAARAAASAS